jgi:hypothetical protein
MKRRTPRPVLVDGAKLAQVSAELQTKLSEAVINLDMEAIDSVIETIRTHDAATAQLLSSLAKTFQYNQIQTLLEAENRK